MNVFTDTLEFSKKLGEAGFSEKQSEALARAFKQQEEGLVTLPALRTELEKMELRMKLWNGATVVVGVTVLAAMRFFG